MTMMRNKALLYKENVSVKSIKRLVKLSNKRVESLTIETSLNMIIFFFNLNDFFIEYLMSPSEHNSQPQFSTIFRP